MSLVCIRPHRCLPVSPLPVQLVAGFSTTAAWGPPRWLQFWDLRVFGGCTYVCAPSLHCLYWAQRRGCMASWFMHVERFSPRMDLRAYFSKCVSPEVPRSLHLLAACTVEACDPSLTRLSRLFWLLQLPTIGIDQPKKAICASAFFAT